MNKFNKQKQYISCRYTYMSQKGNDCIIDVSQNGVFHVYFYIYTYVTCKSLSHISIYYENKISSLFRQCPTKDYGRLTSLERHTSLGVAVYPVRMSLVVGHWHPWQRQGHCMPKTSVKIRTSVCRQNIEVHIYGNTHIYEFNLKSLTFINHFKTFIN